MRFRARRGSSRLPHSASRLKNSRAGYPWRIKSKLGPRSLLFCGVWAAGIVRMEGLCLGRATLEFLVFREV